MYTGDLGEEEEEREENFTVVKQFRISLLREEDKVTVPLHSTGAEETRGGGGGGIQQEEEDFTTDLVGRGSQRKLLKIRGAPEFSTLGTMVCYFIRCFQ